jgi:3-phenylpropionate/trans-cinnamate dioxygenase ferredoxin subunit
MENENNRSFKVATVNDLKTNCFSCEVDGWSILILRHSDGSLTAIEDRCSHADVPLSDGEFDPKLGKITCPAHGAEFCTREGTALCMPAVAPVKIFSVKIIGDEIWIAIP